MRFIIVTGMSGAGKSTALKILEDTGYYCVDNLPVELVPKLGELLLLPGSSISRIALGLDIRSGHSFEKLQKSLEQLDEMKISYEILFLEASDETLIDPCKNKGKGNCPKGAERNAGSSKRRRTEGSRALHGRILPVRVKRIRLSDHCQRSGGRNTDTVLFPSGGSDLRSHENRSAGCSGQCRRKLW